MNTRLFTSTGIVLLGLLLGTVRSAHATERPTAAFPAQSPDLAKLPEKDRADIRAAFEQARHEARQEEDGTWVAHNLRQGWQIRFDGRGFSVQRSAGAESWGLELRGYGFAGAETPVEGTATVSTEATKVSYDWDTTLREWFVNHRSGLEQGWTFQQRPGKPEADGPLRLRLAVRGGLRAAVDADGSAVAFLGTGGAPALRYAGLKAWDAAGRALAVRFEPAEDQTFLVTVDEREARYPITIDPAAEEAVLKSSNWEVNDGFGRSFAISGDTVVVGAPDERSKATGVNGDQTDNSAFSLDGGSLSTAGAAYVFARTSEGWTQQAYLKSSTTTQTLYRNLVRFGEKVAISGNTIAVWAPEDGSYALGINGDPNSFREDGSPQSYGAVYIFVRSGTTWTRQAYIKAEATGFGFGSHASMALSGDTLFVKRLTTAGSSSGEPSSVYIDVFRRTGTTWAKQSSVPINMETQYGHDFVWGTFVATSDRFAFTINERYEPSDVEPRGVVYVFRQEGSTWLQEARLISPVNNDNAYGLNYPFGISLALSSDTLIAGAPSAESSTKGGHAYIFRRYNTTWSLEGDLTASDHQPGDRFGFSVGVSDNLAVALRSRLTSDGNQSTADNVCLFSRFGSTWTEDQLLYVPEGYACAFSSGLIAIPTYNTGVRVLEATSGQVVRNTNRFGQPGPLLANTQVTLVSGDDPIAIATTDSTGHFTFPDPAPELTLAYDVWLERDFVDEEGQHHTVMRMYDSARILGTNAVPLVLPLDLHQRLHTRLTSLEKTGTLVLGYDTTAARTLIDDWNSIEPELSYVHKNRDAALARLQIATEGMVEIYPKVEELSLDTAKLVANTVLSLLAVKEALGDVQKIANAEIERASAMTYTPDAFFATITGLFESGVATTQAYVELQKDDFIEGVKKSGDLEEPWLTALDRALGTIIGAFGKAISDVRFSSFAEGGKKKLYEGLAESLTEQIGGRLLASAYVHETQPSLDWAVTRARAQLSSGTGVEGLEAVNQQTLIIRETVDDTLSKSKLVQDLAKGWGYVADISLVAGKIPGAQVAAVAGATIKAANLGLITTSTVNGLQRLHRVTFTDAPKVPALAFYPSGVTPPTLTTVAPGAGVAASPDSSSETALVAASVPEDGLGSPSSDEPPAASSAPAASPSPGGYASALTSLRAAIVSNDPTAAQGAATAMLSAEPGVRSAMITNLKQITAQARAANPTRPALNNAVAAAKTSYSAYLSLAGTMNLQVAGWFLPSLADPLTKKSDILGSIDAVLAKVSGFDQAVATAETEATGIVTPAELAVMQHGIPGAGISNSVAPGVATFTAQVTNVGGETATGCTLQLSAENPEGPVQAMQITSPATVSVPDLAPGATHTFSWTLTLTDVSGNGSNSAVGYYLVVTKPDGKTQTTTGGFKIITTPVNTAPVVQLTGGSPLVIDARSTYVDPGASGYDEQEGVLPAVMTGNNVIPSVPGTYTVTFTTTDRMGLSGTATRQVQVVASAPPSIAAPTSGFTPLSLHAGEPLPDYAAQAVASDNSGYVTVTQSPPAGSDVVVGTLTVTLTARDRAGNEAQLSFPVTVLPAQITGRAPGDFPLNPRDFYWHQDFTAHPSNGWLYGTSGSGGIYNHGMIFRITTGGDYQALVHFTNNGARNKGKEPAGRMAVGADGTLYGATTVGGANGKGTVFKMTPEGELTTLVSLTGNTGAAMGSQPYGGVIVGPDGNIYGTTQYGGTNDIGTIFKLTPAGVFTTLVSFTGNGATNKGSYPNGSLTFGADGLLYGMTGRGGELNRGTIFRMTLAGELTTLVEFTGATGSHPGGEPWGSLTLGNDGNFYGLTSQGSIADSGTVFRLAPDGTHTVLTPVSGNGAKPNGDLCLGPDGNFYSLASSGGSSGYGTVFCVTPAGEITTLIHFTSNGANDKGATPNGSLCLGPDGNLYGVTRVGGAADRGTVFRVTTAGVLTTLMEGTTRTNGVTSAGGYPNGGLCAAPDGSLYGTTYFGGTSDEGSVFKIDPQGNRSTVISFTAVGGDHPGSRPQCSLMFASDGNFYGCTVWGGSSNLGTVFRLTPSGEHTVLVNFTGNGATNKGAWPSAKLIEGADGCLYGMGNGGGAGDYGTIFRMTKAGVLTTLIELTRTGGSNPGAWPIAGFALGADGDLYGMTNSGGTNDNGTIFKFNPVSLTMTVLVNFQLNGSGHNRGGWPWGGLCFGSDGALYGMTNYGGANNFGTVFKTTTTGTITTLTDFTGIGGAARGAWPSGTMISAPDGFIYGMANSGGTYDFGTLFKMTTSGAITTLAEFKGAGSGIASGGWPNMDEFTFGADGHLYGMTNVGGKQGAGLIYRVEMPQPEIAVTSNSLDISNNDDSPTTGNNTDFGVTALTGSCVVRTFQIENAGTSTLMLGEVTLDGLQASDFAITTAPATSVPAGSFTTLGITFDPSQEGRRVAIVSFATNDQTENPFTFVIAGTGNTPPLFIGQSFTTVQGKLTRISESKVLPLAWDVDGQSLSIVSVAATSAGGAALSRSGGNITYTPPAAFTGIDTFTITFSDGISTKEGTITMTVNADPGLNPANPPQLSAEPGGTIRLSFPGIPGRVYGIQRSTDLSHWTQIGTPAASSQGAISFDDPSPPPSGAFYRIIFPAQ